MTPNTHVRLTNLTRSFHEGEQLHAVLQSLDATFVRGEKVALRGRSGSGKSTLLNLISGIDVPDDGEVEIDGQLITAMSERDRTLLLRSASKCDVKKSGQICGVSRRRSCHPSII